MSIFLDLLDPYYFKMAWILDSKFKKVRFRFGLTEPYVGTPAVLHSGGSIGVEEGVHHSIDLGETRSAKGERYGWGFPPLTDGGLWGASPKKMLESKIQLLTFGGIFMLGITLEPLGRF